MNGATTVSSGAIPRSSRTQVPYSPPTEWSAADSSVRENTIESCGGGMAAAEAAPTGETIAGPAPVSGIKPSARTRKRDGEPNR